MSGEVVVYLNLNRGCGVSYVRRDTPPVANSLFTAQIRWRGNVIIVSSWTCLHEVSHWNFIMVDKYETASVMLWIGSLPRVQYIWGLYPGRIKWKTGICCFFAKHGKTGWVGIRIMTCSSGATFLSYAVQNKNYFRFRFFSRENKLRNLIWVSKIVTACTKWRSYIKLGSFQVW
jgi:hypothetical protein